MVLALYIVVCVFEGRGEERRMKSIFLGNKL
jgi:hypothetical protein